MKEKGDMLEKRNTLLLQSDEANRSSDVSRSERCSNRSWPARVLFLSFSIAIFRHS
jgi:hypothetical protein